MTDCGPHPYHIVSNIYIKGDAMKRSGKVICGCDESYRYLLHIVCEGLYVG